MVGDSRARALNTCTAHTDCAEVPPVLNFTQDCVQNGKNNVANVATRKYLMAIKPPSSETPNQPTGDQLRDVLQNPYDLVGREVLEEAIRGDFPGLERFVQEFEQWLEKKPDIPGAPVQSSEDQMLSAIEIALKKYQAEKKAQEKSTSRQRMEEDFEEAFGSGFKR